MILSKYHLSSINKLVQIAGRATGNKTYVNKITIICPSEVSDAISHFTKSVRDICEINPTHFNKSDFAKLDRTIPVKIVIHNPEVLTALVALKTKGTRSYKESFHAILQRAIYKKDSTVYYRNNLAQRKILTPDGRINRNLTSVRMYSNGEKLEARRFESMHSHFETYCSYGQSCEKTEYSIDFAKDIYFHNGFTNPTNVLWITYTC
jgi:hypothetical protein